MIPFRVQPSQVTALLVAWRKGDEAALDALVPLVHAELRRIAGRCIARERVGQTLQATALVNEAYLRLVDVRQVNWAEPRALSSDVRAVDAAHIGRRRPVEALPKARRRRDQGDAG